MILQFKKFIYCEKSTCAPESTTSLPAPADTQQFYFDAHAKFKCGCVPYGTECGPGCRCRVRSPLLYGTAPYYGTGARADARIRTSVRIRVSFLKTGFGTFFILFKSQNRNRIRVSFLKPGTTSFLKLKRKRKNIHGSGSVKKFIKTENADTQQCYFKFISNFKIQMRMRTVRYGTAPYYGTGARADARIRTSVRIRVSFRIPDSWIRIRDFFILFKSQNRNRNVLTVHSLLGCLDFQIIWKGKIAIIIVTKANPCVKCQKTFSSAFLP